MGDGREFLGSSVDSIRESCLYVRSKYRLIKADCMQDDGCRADQRTSRPGREFPLLRLLRRIRFLLSCQIRSERYVNRPRTC